MSIVFDGQATSGVFGGAGGKPFQDIPGAPLVLVGILYDCYAYTYGVDTYPDWTVYNKFLRAIVPYYAPLNEDGTIGDAVRGTQYGGSNGEFTASGFVMSPPGYVVTALNLRRGWAMEGNTTLVKAFQLAFTRWTVNGIDPGSQINYQTTLSPWQGGDGQLPGGDPPNSPYGLNDANAVPNAPTVNAKGDESINWGEPGRCIIGLAGNSGNLIDALAGVWAVPQIVK